jgi:hypothetical protein
MRMKLQLETAKKLEMLSINQPDRLQLIYNNEFESAQE